MKLLALLIVASAAIPAFAGKSTTTKPQRHETGTGVPGWLQHELKPIVNKPIVTR